ncbi:MAG: hypothetical protein J6Z08_01515 [Elusimicrobiales bacterium]|nr:hypothetical protein [Elusimicrobiales bacterium]
MKITAGACTRGEIAYLLENGADEISCGLNDIPSFCGNHSIPGLKIHQIHEISDEVHSAGKKLFIYANETRPDWSTRIPALRKIFEEERADGFILADAEQIELYEKAVGLNRHISENYSKNVNMPEWHMGILGFCFNSASARRYRSRGVKRIIIPQQILPCESREICSIMPETEFYYLIHEMDKNIDGLCMGCRDDSSEIRFCMRGFRTTAGYVSFPAFSLEERLAYFYGYFGQDSFIKIVRFGSPELRRLVFNEAKELGKLAGKTSTEAGFVAEASGLVSEEYIPKFRELIRKNSIGMLH